MQLEKEYHWRIERIVQETPEVRSHYLRCVGERPTFVAGQYLTVKLPEVTPSEGKAYSIASAPHEDLLRITVKTMGAFSTAINNLAEGATVITSAPYGFFYPEPDDATPLVFVAAGIGITPCVSIIADLAKKRDTRELQLLYANQTTESAVFVNELVALASQHEPFSFTQFLTRQEIVPAGAKKGRLDGHSILEHTATLAAPEFFLVGSIQFVRDMWKGLKAEGIPAERLYTEGFF